MAVGAAEAEASSKGAFGAKLDGEMGGWAVHILKLSINPKVAFKVGPLGMFPSPHSCGQRMGITNLRLLM